jgi:hypothetical protein
MWPIAHRNNAAAATISSDSTSVKGINMVAKHLTVLSADQPGIPRTLALPITSIDDHTSAAQKEDWSASLRDIFAAYATCFERGFTATTWREFIGKIKAASTDHANDQKLLIQLLVAWKQEVDRAIRAESALREMGALELLQRVYSELRKERGENPLTSSDWNALSEEEQARAVGEAWRSVVLPIGEAAFQELSVQEQAEVDSLIWAGCCMHKGMNAAKEGFTGMTDKWVSIAGAAPPVKMVNKDNRAALDNASASERQRIYTLSKGGAAKLTELMGALLNHKDDKKGQQDQYKIAFEVRTDLRCKFRCMCDGLLTSPVARFWWQAFVSGHQQCALRLPSGSCCRSCSASGVLSGLHEARSRLEGEAWLH